MIQNTPDQQKRIDELSGYLEAMENTMKKEVDHTDISSLTYQLSKAITLLATQGKVMELASFLFDWAKGKAVEIVKDEDLKHEVLKLKLSGLLAQHSARFDRSERTVKALTTYIDGLRTLISAEKELSKNTQ